MLHFKGEYTKEISFPLGGIGTGSVGLGGNGHLIDWELYNRPNKGGQNSYTHYAIKACKGNKVLDARVLEGDVYKGMIGDEFSKGTHSWGFGFGHNRYALQGIPHFSDVEFDGRFPVAEIQYTDAHFPGKVRLTAFNPFIPSDDKNSSIPAAFFDWEVENTSEEELEYAIAFSCGNPLKGQGLNTLVQGDGYTGIRLGNEGENALQIATDCEDVAVQEYWFRGSWFDSLMVYWREFSEQVRMPERHYEGYRDPGLPDPEDMGLIEAHMKVQPGEKKSVRFVLGWYFPVFEKYWAREEPKPSWKNYYASLFASVDEVTAYSLKQYDTLLELTKRFRDALYATVMPERALEAAGANLAILKSTTCMRLEDGTFYAFEGTGATAGSCEGSCTHVWNYTYALPFLFPVLERSMRDADFTYNQLPSGEMQFRLQLPIGAPPANFRACVDGQYGGIIKLYRDWMISGDDAFLKRNWPMAKKAIEYAWSPDNKDLWDPQQSGVITGRQHHTLDMELFGPNSWLTGFYIAGLMAGAKMASYLGEEDTAKLYAEIAEKGRKYVDAHLWNGRYFMHEVDVADRSILDPYAETDPNIYNSYWTDEKNEVKYQIQGGCSIDQMLAQWHADLCGLGDVYDPDKVQTALKSLYDINFKSMRDVFNPCRIFAMNDEKGLLICNWEDVYKPQIPIPYSEEVMTGFEYAAAAEMISRGLYEEGLNCVEAVRDRYDGKKRNPYSEIECGNAYARAMASYSLIPIYSGFTYNAPERSYGFDPLQPAEKYTTFWSLDNAWGTFEMDAAGCRLRVLYGELPVAKFCVPDGMPVAQVRCDGKNVVHSVDNRTVILKEEIVVKDTLEFIR